MADSSERMADSDAVEPNLELDAENYDIALPHGSQRVVIRSQSAAKGTLVKSQTKKGLSFLHQVPLLGQKHHHHAAPARGPEEPQISRTSSSKSQGDGAERRPSIYGMLRQRNPRYSAELDSTPMQRHIVRMYQNQINKVHPEIEIGHHGPNGPRAHDEMERVPRLILHPYSGYRIAWDVCSMCFLFYSVVTVPLKTAFDFESQGCSANFFEQRWHWYTDLLVDLMFLGDVLVNLRTAYWHKEHKRTLVVSGWAIFVNYLRGFFFIDVLASIPLDLILLPYCEVKGSSTNNILRAPSIIKKLRMLRVIRLLRVTRIKRFFERIRDKLHIHPGYLRLIKFAFFVSLVAHYNACIFFYIGESYNGEPSLGAVKCGNEAYDWTDPALFTWTTQEFFPGVAGVLPVTCLTISEQYWVSLYWSITTMTTVGFGDITPITTAEVIFCIFIIIQGGAALGYVVGSMADLLSRLNKRKKEHYDKLEYWDDVFYRGAFPATLRRKIRNFHDWMYRNSITKLPSFAEEELSKTLLKTILSSIYRDHLRSVGLFRNISDDALTHLALALEHVQIPPGEVIYREGELGSSMLFLQRGDVNFSILMMSENDKRRAGLGVLHDRICTRLTSSTSSVGSCFGPRFSSVQIRQTDSAGAEEIKSMKTFSWDVNDRTCCCFGESVMFGKSNKRLTTAVSTSGCVLLRLSAERMRDIIGRCPELINVQRMMERKRTPRLKGYARKIIQIVRTMHAHMPRLQVVVHAAAELPKMDNFSGRCDPYVVVSINETGKQGKVESRTLVVYNTYTPVWEESFTYQLRATWRGPVTVTLKLLDWDVVGDDDFAGSVTVDLSELVEQCKARHEVVERGPEWFRMMDESGVRYLRGYRKRISKLHATLRIIPPSKEQRTPFGAMTFGASGVMDTLRHSMEEYKGEDSDGTFSENPEWRAAVIAAVAASCSSGLLREDSSEVGAEHARLPSLAESLGSAEGINERLDASTGALVREQRSSLSGANMARFSSGMGDIVQLVQTETELQHRARERERTSTQPPAVRADSSLPSLSPRTYSSLSAMSSLHKKDGQGEPVSVGKDSIRSPAVADGLDSVTRLASRARVGGGGMAERVDEKLEQLLEQENVDGQAKVFRDSAITAWTTLKSVMGMYESEIQSFREHQQQMEDAMQLVRQQHRAATAQDDDKAATEAAAADQVPKDSMESTRVHGAVEGEGEGDLVTVLQPEEDAAAMIQR